MNEAPPISFRAVRVVVVLVAPADGRLAVAFVGGNRARHLGPGSGPGWPRQDALWELLPPAADFAPATYDDWRKLVAHTKFAQWPDFGSFQSGHISLQGTEDKGQLPIHLWFRNIKLRAL